MFPVSKKYRGLIYYRSNGNLRSEASQTYLSFFWWLLDPIVSMAIYYFFFGIMLRVAEEDFVPFLLIGLALYEWFGNITTQSCNAITHGKPLITQMRFPVLILPSIVVLMGTYKFLVVFCLLLIFLSFYGFPPTWLYLYLPILLFLQFILICAVSYIFAVITPFLRDFDRIVPLGIRLLLFLSAVFFSVERLPEKVQQFFVYNPIATLITSFRDVLMYQRAPNLELLFYTAIGIFCLYAASILVVNKLNPKFARILLQQ